MSPLSSMSMSRLDLINHRRLQLLAHANMVQRCLARVPRRLRERDQETFSVLMGNVDSARHMLSLEEDGEEADLTEQLLSLVESNLIAARDMLTLDDSVFGWSMLDLTEEQLTQQVVAFLSGE